MDLVKRAANALEAAWERYRGTDEEVWDKQAAMNADYLDSQKHRVRLLNQLGISEYRLLGVANSQERSRAEVRDHQWMLDRGVRCPNNPHNGGSRDRGDGAWVDRRGPDWRCVEDEMEIRDRASLVDPLTHDELDRTERDVMSDPVYDKWRTPVSGRAKESDLLDQFERWDSSAEDQVRVERPSQSLYPTERESTREDELERG